MVWGKREKETHRHSIKEALNDALSTLIEKKGTSLILVPPLSDSSFVIIDDVS